jgi:FkbM family methyltransferase
VAVSLPDVVREGHLQHADVRMGNGPFRCASGRANALLSGPQVVSGIREIWCRQVYESAEVCLPSDGLVVDLGANMGNFTILALASGPAVRVVAVEPDATRTALLERQLEINGWRDRCVVVKAFVGPRPDLDGETPVQPGVSDRRLSEADFLGMLGAERIAFLKCDIEGSEFGLLTRDSKLLERTDRIAMEVHDKAGDRGALTAVLRESGFDVWTPRVNPQDAIVLGRRRTCGC